ncbi:hypothetical protein V8C26DRAFT_15234 [Trichoderma gracile]
MRSLALIQTSGSNASRSLELRQAEMKPRTPWPRPPPASPRLPSPRLELFTSQLVSASVPRCLSSSGLGHSKGQTSTPQPPPTSIHGTARLLAGIRDLIAISSHQRTLASGRVQGEPLVRGLPPPPATLFRDLHNSRHYAQHHRLQVIAVAPKLATFSPFCLVPSSLPRQTVLLAHQARRQASTQRRISPASRPWARQLLSQDPGSPAAAFLCRKHD